MEPPHLSVQPTADGSDTLFSAVYGQTYHSINGALTEAEHVFLRGAGVEARPTAGLPTRVLEVGFGAGLNFWATVRCSLARAGKLDYVALEKNLLPAETLAQLNYGALLGESVAELWQQFLELPLFAPGGPPPGEAVWQATDRLRLTLVIGEATTAHLPPGGYHAVYLDAFSPNVNPELWTPEFLAQLYAALEPGGRLATYSVRGSVRRALQAVGFAVSKQPGAPGKREMLVAVRPTTSTEAK
jgi:tRNA U34 5-methylaminomethyl-2-thiouridine-forming methyltransferase MnmC